MRSLGFLVLSACLAACASGSSEDAGPEDPVGEGGSAGAAGDAGKSGSGTSGSGTAGSGTSGSGTAGSGTSGSGTAGTGTSGSGTAGSGTSGSGTAGKSGSTSAGAAGSSGASAGSGGSSSGSGGSGGSSSGSGGSGGSSGGSTCDHKGPGCNPPDTLGMVNGDTGSDVVTAKGTKGRWLSVNVHEGSSLPGVGLSVKSEVKSPPGMKFETYLYWLEQGGICPGKLLGMPDASGTSSMSWGDTFGVDDDRIVLIEVRYISGDACTDEWTLTVTGNP